MWIMSCNNGPYNTSLWTKGPLTKIAGENKMTRRSYSRNILRVTGKWSLWIKQDPRLYIKRLKAPLNPLHGKCMCEIWRHSSHNSATCDTGCDDSCVTCNLAWAPYFVKSRCMHYVHTYVYTVIYSPLTNLSLKYKTIGVESGMCLHT